MNRLPPSLAPYARPAAWQDELAALAFARRFGTQPACDLYRCSAADLDAWRQRHYPAARDVVLWHRNPNLRRERALPRRLFGAYVVRSMYSAATLERTVTAAQEARRAHPGASSYRIAVIAGAATGVSKYLAQRVIREFDRQRAEIEVRRSAAV